MQTLTVYTEGGAHCWPIGDPTPEQVADLAVRARIITGTPAEDLSHGRVAVAPGDPHPRLRATMHSAGSLAGVPQASVDTYAAAQAAATRRVRLDSAQASVTALSVAEQTELRSRVGWPGVIPGPESRVS